MILLALIVAPPPQGDPFTEPRECVTIASSGYEGGQSVWSGPPPNAAGWRVWGERPLRVGTTTALGTVSLTQTLTISTTDTYINAIDAEPYNLFVCAPDSLPPGGGYRRFFPGVTG